jgi:hypothetical protein
MLSADMTERVALEVFLKLVNQHMPPEAIDGLCADRVANCFQKEAPMAKRILSPRDVKEEYGLSIPWQDRARMNGWIRYFKLSPGRTGTVRYRREDIESWIDANMRRSTSDTPADQNACDGA